MQQREKIAFRSTPVERPETADQSDNGNFLAVTMLFGEVEIRGTSDQMPSPERLKRFAEWPDITRLSCQLFGHASFTRSTWGQLTTWLRDLSRGNWNHVVKTQRSIIVKLLQEATAEKQKSGAVLGGAQVITNQELRLWLPVIRATISSNAMAIKYVRERIADRGAVDPAVTNLLAEKSSDAGDVLDRLGCLLANGVFFSE